MDYSYIVTYTGKRIYPLDPDPDEICIEDIAHALSNKCRFGGHTRAFYSVAQHSIIVSNFCGDPLNGLLHDAAEAYLADVASTIKPAFPLLNKAEFLLMEAIYAHFDLPDVTEEAKKAIKLTDKSVLRLEWNALMNNPNGYALHPKLMEAPKMHWELAGFWPPIEAKRVFLRRFRELYKED